MSTGSPTDLASPRLRWLAQEIRKELDLVTEPEFAAAIEVKVNTLQVWRSHGEGPDYVKLGKTVFYRLSDVRVWAQKNTHKPQPSQGRAA